MFIITYGYAGVTDIHIHTWKYIVKNNSARNGSILYAERNEKDRTKVGGQHFFKVNYNY